MRHIILYYSLSCTDAVPKYTYTRHLVLQRGSKDLGLGQSPTLESIPFHWRRKFYKHNSSLKVAGSCADWHDGN